jgi:hypothetical protein
MNRVCLWLFLVTAGCGTKLSYMPLNTSPRTLTARDPGTVEMFTSSKPERPFVEVGMLEAQQESVASLDSETTVFSKLREDGASRGCDGLVVTGGNDAVVVTGHGSSTTLRGYRATCIVYKEVSAQSAAQAAGAPDKK